MAYRLWNAQTGKPATPVNSPQVYGQLASPFATIKFSPDGKRGLWRTAPNPKVLDYDGTPGILFEAATGKSTGPPLRHGIGIVGSEFSPDGGLVLTAGADGSCRVWDARTGKPMSPLLPHRTNAQPCVFAANGRRFATADSDGDIRVWELGARATSGDTIPARDDQLASSFNSSVVLLSVPGATSTLGFPVRPNSSEENALLARLPNVPNGSWRRAIFSPDVTRGLALITKGDASKGSIAPASASLWALRPGAQEIQFADPTGESSPAELRDYFGHVTHAAFSPNSRCLATVSATGDAPTPANVIIRLWDAETGRSLSRPLIYSPAVNCIAPDTTGVRWAIGSVDGMVKIWDLDHGVLVGPPLRHEAAVVSCTFSPVENALVACCASLNSPTDRLRIWDASINRPISPQMSVVGFSELYPSFNSSGTRIQFADGQGYDVKADSHSADDLDLLVELLSGQQIDAAIGAIPVSRADLRTAWTRLRTRFSDAFEIPAESVLRWHEQQLNLAIAADEPSAIMFQRHWLAVELARAGWRPDTAASKELDIDGFICRLCAIAANGRSSEAAAAASRIARGTRQPDQLFNLARVVALAASDQSQPKERVAKFANESIRLLRLAIDAGSLDDGQLKDDADLASLHGRPEFEQIVRELEAKKKGASASQRNPNP
jgi:WD40 repeat protein